MSTVLGRFARLCSRPLVARVAAAGAAAAAATASTPSLSAAFQGIVHPAAAFGATQLDEQQDFIYANHFAHAVSKYTFRMLLGAAAHGGEVTGNTGSRDVLLIKRNEKPDLVLLLSGTARIEVPMDGKYARLERGPGFLGEIGFLRACCTWTTDRESTFRATGDVFITPGSTYLYWESEQLRRAVAENEWLHRAIIALIALTLANKLTDDYRAPEPLPTRLRSRAQAKHSSKLDA